MAEPVNINNVSSLTDSQLQGMTARELDEVITLLSRIKSMQGQLNTEQQKVAASAAMYRKELEKAHSTVESTARSSDSLAGRFTSALSSISSLVTSIDNTVNHLAKPWGDADQAAFNFGKTLGANAATAARLRDETIKFANTNYIGINYNTSIKEMIELQQKYTQTVGRNLQLSDKQKETLLATYKVMGDKGLEFASKLENIGVGLERSGELATKMYSEAAKSGISFEKTSKYVTENLTKVQSYGFKNGVEGLTSMAKKAAEVNLNIAEAFKIADKIQSGGIQEAIKMGAGLQVLGGSFAQFGDPMGMLYQGLNDAEGLQDRMVKMFSGYGRIKNGQVDISNFDKMRIKTAAQTMGVSPDEMLNMVSRQAVRGRVESQMKGNAIFEQDKELAELIKNTATLNKDNQAVVNIAGREKKLSEITSADKEYLKDMQKSEADDIKDIAQMMRGYDDMRSGRQKAIENNRARMYSWLGSLSKDINRLIGTSNWLLGAINVSVGIMAVANIAGSVMNAGSSIKNLFGKGGGGIGRGVGGGSGAGAGGIGGGVAGGGAAAGARTFMARSGAQVTTYGKATIPRAALANRNITSIVAEGDTILGSTRSGAVVDLAKKSRNMKRDAEVLKRARSIQRATSAAKSANAARGASTAANVAKGAGSAMSAGASAGFAVAGGAIAALTYAIDGSWKGNRAQKNKAIGGTVGATVGGLTAFIPVVGPFIAPIATFLGQKFGESIGKAVTKHQDKARGEARRRGMAQLGMTTERARDFANLKGDYKKAELEAITNALKDGKITDGELSKSLMKKLAKNGDSDIVAKYADEAAKAKFDKVSQKINAKVGKGDFNVENATLNLNNATFPGSEEVPKFAAGGKIKGAKHANGGVYINAEGGEYIVAADAAAKNERALDYINAGGEITPSMTNNPMAPIKVKEVGDGGYAGYESPTKSIEVSPIKLDVSGTIKLEANGQQVDLDAIINNPAFLTQLTQMVERRISDYTNSGNFKETRKNKQHTY